jgi:hypothetical protein
VKENPAEEISKLRQQPGDDLFIFSSANLSSTFRQYGLESTYPLAEILALIKYKYQQ